MSSKTCHRIGWFSLPKGVPYYFSKPGSPYRVRSVTSFQPDFADKHRPHTLSDLYAVWRALPDPSGVSVSNAVQRREREVSRPALFVPREHLPEFVVRPFAWADTAVGGRPYQEDLENLCRGVLLMPDLTRADYLGQKGNDIYWPGLDVGMFGAEQVLQVYRGVLFVHFFQPNGAAYPEQEAGLPDAHLHWILSYLLGRLKGYHTIAQVLSSEEQQSLGKQMMWLEDWYAHYYQEKFVRALQSGIGAETTCFFYEEQVRKLESKHRDIAAGRVDADVALPPQLIGKFIPSLEGFPSK